MTKTNAMPMHLKFPKRHVRKITKDFSLEHLRLALEKRELTRRERRALDKLTRPPR
jgi:hypothetical protein